MSKEPRWRAKAVYIVFALALVVGLMGAAVVVPAPAPAQAQGDEINTLRIYGRCSENADFPYDDYRGPFVLSDAELADPDLAPQIPPKDFIQWNPAYMWHGDTDSAGKYGNFFVKIKANNNDASEKVHLRQWYVPKYCEPSGMVWADEEAVYSPDLVKEYTYILVDARSTNLNNPVAGLPGQTKLVLPIADQSAQIGLDDYDVDGDGFAEITYLNHIGMVGKDEPGSHEGDWPDEEDTYAFSPCADGLVTGDNEILDDTPWIDISAEPLVVTVGDVLHFLDHTFMVTDITTGVAPSITVDLWYSGNKADDTLYPNLIIYEDETLSAGRHLTDVNVEDLTADTPAIGWPSPVAPPSQSEAFIDGTSFLSLIKAPWYLQLTGAPSETEAHINVGRLVVEGESFFVDGAEYEIAKIHTVCDGLIEVEDELIGIGDASETEFGPVTFANCDGIADNYFGDCDGDGAVKTYPDTPSDVVVKVNGASVNATSDRDNGKVTLGVAPLLNDVVTIDYCYHSYAFKYITIRNPLPKVNDVFLPALSVTKEGVGACPELMPLLPPFNMQHDMIDDTNIPDCFMFVDSHFQNVSMPDVQLPDNIISDLDDLNGATGDQGWGNITNDDTAGDDTLVFVGYAPGAYPQFAWLPIPNLCGDVSFLPFIWNSIAERLIEDVAASEECWVQEAKEPRFDTNLLEEKFTEPTPTPTPGPEEWQWINIETLPWDYTELQLPEVPDITDPVNNDDGDYILVSSWMTEDTRCVHSDTCHLDPMIRVKFVYDAAVGALNSADIYVNDGLYNAEYNNRDGLNSTVIDAASLRVYGRCNLSAAFPYETYQGPFDLTSSEAPPKDFIQWNPAYMYHWDTASNGIYDDFFLDIEASNIDANEKVHLRQWYVPKYTEPSGMVWMEPDCVTGPSIIKEYTYILLDPNNDPVPGLPEQTAFVFPIADNSDQIGLDDYNMNKYDKDGIVVDTDADIVHLETASAVDPDAAPDDDQLWPPSVTTEAYSCDPLLTPNNQIPGDTNWIDISTGVFTVEYGDTIRFLDHAVTIGTISDASQLAWISLYYIGKGYQDDDYQTVLEVEVGETLSAGRTNQDVETQATLGGSPPLPPSQSAKFKLGTSKLQLVEQPWYLQVRAIAGGYANIVVGRLLVEGETFFVDGAEYEIAKLHMYQDPQNGDMDEPIGLKYITLRNDLPKELYPGQPDVDLGALSVWKKRIAPCYEWPCVNCIPLLPPFNMQHDMIDDVNIPDGIHETDSYGQHVSKPDWQGIDNSKDSKIASDYDLIAERWVADVAAIEECWKDEAKESRFDTNLLQEKFTENTTDPLDIIEEWRWKNIETLPWDYTEFVLPALPDKPTECGYTTGDYILVSSFLTEDTICSDGASCLWIPIRVKFYHDAEYRLDNVAKTGVYVNTIGLGVCDIAANAGTDVCGYEDQALDLSGSAIGGWDGGAGPYDWDWDFDGGTGDTAAQNPSVTWADPGVYEVGLEACVTAHPTCCDTDTVTVTIVPTWHILSPSLEIVSYPGGDCAFPQALTNIGPPTGLCPTGDPGALDCVILVWGQEDVDPPHPDTEWCSYSTADCAGKLLPFGLENGKPYVIYHSGCFDTYWEMCCP